MSVSPFIYLISVSSVAITFIIKVVVVLILVKFMLGSYTVYARLYIVTQGAIVSYISLLWSHTSDMSLDTSTTLPDTNFAIVATFHLKSRLSMSSFATAHLLPIDPIQSRVHLCDYQALDTGFTCTAQLWLFIVPLPLYCPLRPIKLCHHSTVYCCPSNSATTLLSTAVHQTLPPLYCPLRSIKLPQS